MDNKKKIAIIMGGILVIALLFGSLFFFAGDNNKDDNDVKMKDNVNIITSETEMEYQPISVTEDTISFKNNPEYEVGDVIVAGILESAPNGFIRKVVNVTEESGVFEYQTENAVLTDVFEEAHIIKTFAVTEDEVKDMEEIDNGVMTLDVSFPREDVDMNVLSSEGDYDVDIQEVSAVEINPNENGLGLVVELEDKIGECVQVNGQVELNNYFELKIDIEDGEIDFGMALHTDTSGELFVGYQEELFDKENPDESDGEYEKEIINKALPNIQFTIGTVPVVVTNDFELIAAVSAQVEGQIDTTIGVNAERISGFEYSSKTGNIVEINEKKYLSDGMEWDTEASASGELEAGIYTHLIIKLYGSTGTDLSIGIAGVVAGELSVGVDEKLTPTLYGKLALSVGPKASGKIVVTVPVVDYDLVETDIFNVTLPVFWEKEWEVPDPMLIAMQKGDFSCFAGTYIATPEDNDGYGGGEKLNSLELKKDGSLSGGDSYFSEEFYPKTTPVSVEKLDDGTYLCTLDENCQYTIYPVGVIEDREYVLENQAYLRDVVYIRCFVFDGSVLDVTYYSDSIADVVTDYRGDDWVSQEAYTEEIGQKLVSGTGTEYKVVATENNFDVGGERIRVVLETKDGKRWMIPNLPNYQYDAQTEIIYFDIYEYVSDPDYVEYN